MKRFVIIFISLIVGYALYWCISDYNYRYNKINSIVGIYKLDFNHTDSEIYKDSKEKVIQKLCRFQQMMYICSRFYDIYSILI